MASTPKTLQSETCFQNKRCYGVNVPMAVAKLIATTGMEQDGPQERLLCLFACVSGSLCLPVCVCVGVVMQLPIESKVCVGVPICAYACVFACVFLRSLPKSPEL